MTDLSLNKERLLIAWADSRGDHCLACKHLMKSIGRPITKCRINVTDDTTFVNVSPRSTHLCCKLFPAGRFSASGQCWMYEKASKPEDRLIGGMVLTFNKKATDEIVALIETERASVK